MAKLYKPLITEEDDGDGAPLMVPDMGEPAAITAPVPAPMAPRAPASSSVPPPSNKEDYTLSPEELAQAREDKKRIAMWGAIGDNLSSRTSFGNAFLGRPAAANNTASTVAGDRISDINQGIKDKQTLAKQEQTAPNIAALKKLQDPTSAESEFERKNAKLAVESLRGSDMFKDNPNKDAMLDNLAKSFDSMDGYSINQYVEKSPLLKSAGTNSTALTKAGIMGAIAGRSLNLKEQGLRLREDNQAAGAAAAFDKDPLMISLVKQKNQLSIDRHTIESAPMITPQMLSEISTGIGMALAGGHSIGMHSADMQSLATSQTAMASLVQKLTNEPQNGASPEIKKQAIDTIARLEAAYGLVQNARVKQLSTGRSYTHNKGAQDAIKSKVDEYAPTNPANPAQPVAKRSVSEGEIQEYAKAHSMTPDNAKTFLRSQGYGTD